VRDLLPLQAYSQKQLSAVGVRTDELVRFIRTPIKAELDRIGTEIDRQKSDTKKIYGTLIQKRRMLREQGREQLELDSLSQRVEALRQELKGVGEEDRKVLASHDLFLQEEQEVEKRERELDQVREMATDFGNSLSELPSPSALAEGMPNEVLIARVRAELARVVEATKASIDSVITLLVDGSPQIQQYARSVGEWKSAFQTHNERYEKAKHDAASQKDQLTEIAVVEAKIKELRTSISQSQGAIELFGDPEKGFADARKEWVGLYRTHADILAFKCSELTRLSGGRIKANLARGTGCDKAKERLNSLLSGTRILTRKVDQLCDFVAKNLDPLTAWGQAVAELEQLIDYSNGEADEQKVLKTPLVNAGREVQRPPGSRAPVEMCSASFHVRP
jgi:chromosome segregation protein